MLFRSTCGALKSASERLDANKSIKYVGMNTVEGKELVAARGLDMSNSAYAIEENVVFEKARMVSHVLSYHGFIGALLRLPFQIPWLSDKLYDFLALHRTHITKNPPSTMH